MESRVVWAGGGSRRDKNPFIVSFWAFLKSIVREGGERSIGERFPSPGRNTPLTVGRLISRLQTRDQPYQGRLQGLSFLTERLEELQCLLVLLAQLLAQ